MEESINILNSSDRCDSCSAQAYIEVTLAMGALLFCSHHWNKYKEVIEPTMISIVNETHRLYPSDKPVDVVVQ
jgi:hypothetical protein